MQPSVAAICLFLALTGAMNAGADDTRPMHLELQPPHDVLAEDDGVSNLAPATAVTQLPYRSSIEYLSPVLPRSGSAYRNFIARFSVSEIVERNAAPDLRMDLNSRVGVQWGMDGQRPSLAYRMSRDTVVRLRGSRHGARVIMHLKY